MEDRRKTHRFFKELPFLKEVCNKEDVAEVKVGLVYKELLDLMSLGKDREIYFFAENGQCIGKAGEKTVPAKGMQALFVKTRTYRFREKIGDAVARLRDLDEPSANAIHYVVMYTIERIWKICVFIPPENITFAQWLKEQKQGAAKS